MIPSSPDLTVLMYLSRERGTSEGGEADGAPEAGRDVVDSLVFVRPD